VAGRTAPASSAAAWASARPAPGGTVSVSAAIAARRTRASASARYGSSWATEGCVSVSRSSSRISGGRAVVVAAGWTRRDWPGRPGSVRAGPARWTTSPGSLAGTSNSLTGTM
jgi:hypothetical protein